MATSSEIQGKLVENLRIKAVISQSEQVYLAIPSLLEEAFAEHAPEHDGDFTLLPVREYELVTLLAWERVCLSRASAAAPQSSVKQSSVNFNADRDTPYEKNMRLAKELRARYEKLLAAMEEKTVGSEEKDSGDIIQGELYRVDEHGPVSVPLISSASLKAKLQLVSTTDATDENTEDGTAVLKYSISDEKFISSVQVYVSYDPNIEEEWNAANNNVSASATLEQTITDPVRTKFKLTGLDSGDVFVLLRVTDTKGRVTFSNEVRVTIGALT